MKSTGRNERLSRCLRRGVCLLLFNFSLLSCAVFNEKGLADEQQNPVLRFRLEAQPSYIIGQPVPITFTLENLTNRDIYVLTWYTPLEGVKGKIFKVTRDGTEIPYEGRMVKRGNPAREDYIHITSRGSSAPSTVDLSLSFNMTVPGEYHVEFIKRVYDLTFNEHILPRKQAEHQGVHIPGNAVTFRMISP